MDRMRTAICLLGVAALIASCGQDQPVGSGNASSETLPLPAAIGDTVVLPYGETIVVEPEVLEVTFDSVLQDSRCPMNAYCFWEGVAIIQLRLVTPSPEAITIALASHDNIPLEIGTVVDTLGYRFELLSIDPYPADIEPIPLPDYVATLSIVASEPAESAVPDVSIPSRSTKVKNTSLLPGPVPSSAGG